MRTTTLAAILTFFVLGTALAQVRVEGEAPPEPPVQFGFQLMVGLGNRGIGYDAAMGVRLSGKWAAGATSGASALFAGIPIGGRTSKSTFSQSQFGFYAGIECPLETMTTTLVARTGSLHARLSERTLIGSGYHSKTSLVVHDRKLMYVGLGTYISSRGLSWLSVTAGFTFDYCELGWVARGSVGLELNP